VTLAKIHLFKTEMAGLKLVDVSGRALIGIPLAGILVLRGLEGLSEAAAGAKLALMNPVARCKIWCSLSSRGERA
jgi:hypothetical protein